jgi:hypothetical protein
MRRISGRLGTVGSVTAAIGLVVYLGLGSGLRPGPAIGQDLPAAEATVAASPEATPTPLPSPEATPTPPPPGASPMEDRLSADQAIDLIWKGEYDRAERALQVLAHTTAARQDRAELLVYLAFLASIRHEDADARTLLRQALAESPSLALSPVEFPKALRDLLTEVRVDLVREKPRPPRGSLGNPRQVLAPEATPLGWSKSKPWYRRWYVWAGIGAAVAVTAVLVGKGHGEGPTGTPTASPTPTATPTLFVYEEQTVDATPPCIGGETVHEFPFPPPPMPTISGTVIVRTGTVVLQVQGDYDGIDQMEEFARLRIENNPAVLTQDSMGSFCSLSLEKVKTDDTVSREIQAALRDGVIQIFVNDGRGVNDNCDHGCTPLHRVKLSFTYSVVSP